MRSRIIQLLIILYSLLTLKMAVDEQWVAVCVLMLFGYAWMVCNWDTNESGTAVEKMVYRALILALVLTAIVAAVENVWWLLPVIAFVICVNLDRV